MNLTIGLLGFGIRLYGDSELSKHFSKCFVTDAKNYKKSNLI